MPTQPKLTILNRVEFPDGYATVMVLIENVEGAPRHTHPGLETTYVLEGEFKLLVDGRPEQPLRPGDWFEVPAETPHSVENVGGKPGRALGHYVIEKDKPLTTWLQDGRTLVSALK
jgi:quercetin dioxygenase-like cupin family protein